MDVQPIILMSLGLFSLLAIVTLIISYVSYKMKMKNDPQVVHANPTQMDLISKSNSIRNNYIHGYQQKDTRPKTHKAETFIRPKIHYQEINESESKMFSIDRTVKRYNVYKTDEHWLDEKKNFRKSYMGRTTITDDNVFDFYLDD